MADRSNLLQVVGQRLQPRPVLLVQRRAFRRIIAAIALCLVASFASSCSSSGRGSALPLPRDSSNATAATDADLLRSLEAKQLVVMAGDDELHAYLGVLDAEGLSDLRTQPPLATLSNLSGNGREVVLGGAAVPAVEAGFLQDGVYSLDGQSLTQLAEPGSNYFAPALSPSGVVVAITPNGGFSTLDANGRGWVRDSRLARKTLAPVLWDGADRMVTVLNPGSSAARVVVLPPDGGVRRGPSAHCGVLALPSPAGDHYATVPPPGRKADASCSQAWVVSQAGSQSLPVGWRPLLWTADGSRLLISRVSGGPAALGLWEPDEITMSASVKTRIWAAALL